MRVARIASNRKGQVRESARLALGVAAGVLLASAGALAQDTPAPVHVRLENELSLGTLALLQRSLRVAHESSDPCLVVELDTPGGEVSLMWQIAKAIDQANIEGVRTVCWVNEHALSAGVLVAISCDRVYARDRAAIGAATPVTFGPEGLQSLADLDPKSASAIAAMVRGWAKDHGRSPELALAMVDPETEVYEVEIDGMRKLITGEEWRDMRLGLDPPQLLRTVAPGGRPLTLTGSEALELGFIDGIVESLDDVLAKIGYPRVAPRTVVASRSEEILGQLNELSMLFLVAGLILAFVELKTPGFGLAGTLSAACFVLLFSARYLVGLADIPHIVAAALGAGLIAAELFVAPGTIWLGLGGFVCLLAAIVFGQLGPGFHFSNALDQVALRGVLDELVLGLAGAVVIAWLVSRWLPDTPFLRRLVLAPASLAPPGEAVSETKPAIAIGSLGQALTDLRPVGKVVLDGEPAVEYEARAEGLALERGARVRVVELGAGRLVVADDAPRAADDPLRAARGS